MHDPIVCTCIHTAFEKDTCDLHMSYIICLDVAGLRTSERRQIQESLSGDGKAKRISFADDRASGKRIQNRDGIASVISSS
jgi:hypothetical protein